MEIVRTQNTDQYINQSALKNDQSFVKGALWGYSAYVMGSLTLGLGAYALMTSPVLFIRDFAGLHHVPISLAVGTLAAGLLTKACVKNTDYHLTQRKIVIIKNN